MTTIIDAMSVGDCFGPWFEGDSWDAWKAILKAAFALPLTPQELIIFGEPAGGRSSSLRRVRELIVAAGRRAGKDSIASLLATFAATIEQSTMAACGLANWRSCSASPSTGNRLGSSSLTSGPTSTSCRISRQWSFAKRARASN